MKPEYHPNIPAELAAVRPMGDFVLVRREPDRGENIIIAADWKKNPSHGMKRGTVIACGYGDRAHIWRCRHCNAYTRTTLKAPKACSGCEGKDLRYYGAGRHPMHVKPGDEVLYNRAPANHVTIGDQEFTFLHEEQHVLAVLEAA